MMSRLVVFLGAALPLYLVRWRVGGMPTTLLELLLYGFFIVAFFRAARGGRLKEFLTVPPQRLFRWGALLLLGGLAVSVLAFPSSRTLGIAKGWFFDPVLLFLLVRYAIRESGLGAGLPFLRAYLASAAAVSIAALFYYVGDLVTFNGRLAAFYDSPNQLAMHLAPGLLIAVLLAWERRAAASVYHAGAAVVIGIALFLSGSAGAWLSVAGALVLGVVMAWRADRFRLKAICATGALGMLLPLFAVYSWPALRGALSLPERSSLASRVTIWRSALAIGRNHSVLGIGPGNFQDQYLAYQKNYPPYPEWAVPQPHNVFLAFWLQTGLLGLAGFLALLAWFFREGARINTMPGSLGGLLTVLMLSFLLHGAVDTTYWRNDLSAFFWMLLALASVDRGDQQEQGSPTRLHPPGQD